MPKRNLWCVVPGCNSDSRKKISKYPFMKDVEFHHFPKNINLQHKWVNAIRRPLDYKPEPWHNVCSRHFCQSNTEVPTLFPWNNYGVDQINRPSTSIANRLFSVSNSVATEKVPEQTIVSDVQVDLPGNQPQHLYSVYSNDDVVPRLKVPIALKECEITTDISIDEPPAKDHSYAKYVYKFDSEKHPEQIRSIGTQADLSANEIENLIREKGEQQSSSCHTKDHFMQTATSSDKKVTFYTGVSSLHIFLGLFKILEPVILKYYSGTGSVNEKRYERGGEKPGPSRKLTKYEEFTLTLIRLRHAVPVTLLADLFNVSSSRVSQVFTTWIYHISEVTCLHLLKRNFLNVEVLSTAQKYLLKGLGIQPHRQKLTAIINHIIPTKH